MSSKKGLKKSALENRHDKNRQRRRRTAFTDEHLDRLEEAFENDKFPGIQIREDLSRELNIKEDRIQVWFQNRRARWRKHELKNKPATGLPISEQNFRACDIYLPNMMQPPPTVFPPLHSVSFRPWEPFYAPFTTKQVLALTRDFELSQSDTTDSLVTQANNAVVHLLETNSASRGPSPTASQETLYQASSFYDSDSGGSHYSAEDYSAAVTLACCFQRET